LLIRLLRSLALWWGRRTKVAAATTGPRPFARTARARATKAAAAARSAKPSAAARSRAAEPTTTGTRAAEATSAATWATGSRSVTAGSTGPGTAGAARRSAGSAIFARARFAYSERATHEQLPIELPDRRFGGFTIGVFNKGKTARTAGFAVERAHDLRRLSDLCEVHSQVVFSGLIWKIAYEQSNWWHG
jgi:hypothetical protein